MMAKLNFQQPLVSHDPSEIILICWFAAKETFLIFAFKNIKTNRYYSRLLAAGCIYSGSKNILDTSVTLKNI